MAGEPTEMCTTFQLYKLGDSHLFGREATNKLNTMHIFQSYIS